MLSCGWVGVLTISTVAKPAKVVLIYEVVFIFEVNFRKIQGKSLTNLRQIFGKSQANSGQILSKSGQVSEKSKGNLRQILGKYQENLRQMWTWEKCHIKMAAVGKSQKGMPGAYSNNILIISSIF